MKSLLVLTLALATSVTASPVATLNENENTKLEKRGCPVGSTAYTNCARACFYRYQSSCNTPEICRLIAEYTAKCNQCCIDICNLC
ncbi:hypothetical protein TWF788_000169 [Orbilia oligospora]|uniref:Uncharacterized protein n=1 Tax=Orbilia oligospora TaxID=2813651 RepID=A0A7C8U4V6_ORBOL|nr:hypothetical protein TWF788_000169 [Orbilia oligospora]